MDAVEVDNAQAGKCVDGKGQVEIRELLICGKTWEQVGHSIKGWINITAADCVRVADDIHLVERRRKRRRNKDLMKHPNSLVNPIRQLSTPRLAGRLWPQQEDPLHGLVTNSFDRRGCCYGDGIPVTSWWVLSSDWPPAAWVTALLCDCDEVWDAVMECVRGKYVLRLTDWHEAERLKMHSPF